MWEKTGPKVLEDHFALLLSAAHTRRLHPLSRLAALSCHSAARERPFATHQCHWRALPKTKRFFQLYLTSTPSTPQALLLVCLATFATSVTGQATPAAAADTTTAAQGTHLARPYECTFSAGCAASNTCAGGKGPTGPTCNSPTGGKIAVAIIVPIAIAVVCSVITACCMNVHNSSWRRGALASQIEAVKKQKQMPGANVGALNAEVAALESAVRPLLRWTVRSLPLSDLPARTRFPAARGFSRHRASRESQTERGADSVKARPDRWHSGPIPERKLRLRRQGRD